MVLTPYSQGMKNASSTDAQEATGPATSEFPACSICGDTHREEWAHIDGRWQKTGKQVPLHLDRMVNFYTGRSWPAKPACEACLENELERRVS